MHVLNAFGFRCEEDSLVKFLFLLDLNCVLHMCIVLSFQIGKEQEYVLGQILRTKYGDDMKFLDETFNVKDVRN